MKYLRAVRWRRVKSLGAVLGLVLAAGCVMSPRWAQYAETAREYDVSPVVVEKLEKGRSLDLEDVERLTQDDVPDSVIIGYLRVVGDVYSLKSEHVARLREAGVGEEVIDYLLSTPTTAWRRARQMRTLRPFQPYICPPGYYDPFLMGPFMHPYYY